MLTAILQAIAALPTIFKLLDKWVSTLYVHIKSIQRKQKIEKLRKAAEDAKKTKDQRDLEKRLRS